MVRRLLILVVLSLAATACGLFSDNVAVIGINFYEDDMVSLSVASCNGAPIATVAELERGRYRVEASTTQDWNRGQECADGVNIEVAENLAVVTIEDAVGGETFTFPPLEGPGPPEVALDGTWQMIEVNGEVVEVGVNTIEIPEITIDAGFLRRLGCNGGGAELLIEGSMVRGVLESTTELCSIPDGSEILVPTERILVAMLESDDGAFVERGRDTMIWTKGGDALKFTLVGM